MIDVVKIDRDTEQLLALARKKFGVRTRSLDKAMRKIGRRVPSRLHDQAKVISEARALAGHPKLMLQADSQAVQKAFDEITAHLKTIDVTDRRKGAVLDVLGSISLNLIGLFLLLVAFLLWKGYL